MKISSRDVDPIYYAFPPRIDKKTADCTSGLPRKLRRIVASFYADVIERTVLWSFVGPAFSLSIFFVVNRLKTNGPQTAWMP